MGNNYEHLLFPFERTVLCSYRASPDKYILFEDDFGGRLKTITDVTHPSPESFFEVRFGYRLLKDGRRCLAAFGPDFFQRLPKKEQLIWRGHFIEHPTYGESDHAFDRWVERSLGGRWVEPGPKYQLLKLISLIRALTAQTIEIPFWYSDNHQLLNYPIAENTDAYAKANLELYRVLVDGLSKEALIKIAAIKKVKLTDPEKTLNSLKEILPPRLISEIHAPIRKCSTERQKVHGVPSLPASAFPAFDSFNGDLSVLVRGIDLLRTFLEETLCASAKRCLKRENAMSIFPKFIGPPNPNEKLQELEKTKGKTIESVDFGETHGRSEAIVLHFTDGSAVSIQIGTNAFNIAETQEKFSPEELKTDLMVFWAPSVKS